MSGAERTADIVIIGGGPAGLAAALGAHEEGARDILILERDYAGLGGILNQCVHSGFGLHRFGEELTGPEYAERDILAVRERGIPALPGTMALDITPDRVVTAVSEQGLLTLRAQTIVLAMGCRERPRGALNIPGTRPAGIFTAGTAQKFVNIDGYMPGREVVILGSGDIGLIMARRMTLEGAHVKAVVELSPFPGGLQRNVAQCLDDFGIPLLLSHTVTRIAGRERLEGVDVTQMDVRRQPVPDSTRFVPCDTLLLSVGLLPENELSRSAGVEIAPATGGPVAGADLHTSVPGIFACGNVLHVHDLADSVSAESRIAGQNAARFVAGRALSATAKPVAEKKPAPPVLPGTHALTCTGCPSGCQLVIEEAENGHAVLRVTGNRCPKGEAYAKAEFTSPTRMLSSTVRLRGGTAAQLPVKTRSPIPKHLVKAASRALSAVEVSAPVSLGQVIVPDVCDTSVDIVATRTIGRR